MLKAKELAAILLAVIIVATVTVFMAAAPVAADEGIGQPKVWVCKYVQKPGANEVLKPGKNPINVSNRAARQLFGTVSPTIGQQATEYFNDRHERSVVVAPGTECGEPPPPPPPPTIIRHEYGLRCDQQQLFHRFVYEDFTGQVINWSTKIEGFAFHSGHTVPLFGSGKTGNQWYKVPQYGYFVIVFKAWVGGYDPVVVRAAFNCGEPPPPPPPPCFPDCDTAGPGPEPFVNLRSCGDPRLLIGLHNPSDERARYVITFTSKNKGRISWVRYVDPGQRKNLFPIWYVGRTNVTVRIDGEVVRSGIVPTRRWGRGSCPVNYRAALAWSERY